MVLNHPPHAAAGAPGIEDEEGAVGDLKAYQELGSYWAAARLCGTTETTVRWVLGTLRRLAGHPLVEL